VRKWAVNLWHLVETAHVLGNLTQEWEDDQPTFLIETSQKQVNLCDKEKNKSRIGINLILTPQHSQNKSK
jgi:hypothetical protein